MKMRRTAHLTLAVASLVLLNILPTSAASVPAYDTDGDGIPDSWEMYGYDADGDGAIDVDYPAMGANPNHKDVFVEMDYMPGELGSDEDLDRIVQSFAALKISNPDRKPGINLHLDAGSARSARYNLGGGNEVSHQGLRNMGDWARIKAHNFDPAREGIFHYMIWGDYHGNNSSSGMGYKHKAGFVVTVGKTYWGGASSDIRVGTFLHELGHNLGLDHGGNDAENSKPHYFSVMNYDYQLTGVPMKDGTFYFGYSQTDALSLDESALSERRGFGFKAHGYLYEGKPADRNIDFNHNGKIDDVPVAKDLNNNGYESVLSAPSDLKTMRFPAQAVSHGRGISPEPPPEIEINLITADDAREQGLIR